MPANYVVRPGDNFSKIAAAHGFSNYREIYDHPSNAGFRAKRPNPNVIQPGDVIVIPDRLGKAPNPSPPVAPPVNPTVRPGSPMYVLSLPSLVSQVEANDCWAAGLASFLRVKGINQSASRENLKVKHASCLTFEFTTKPALILEEKCVHPVFSSEGCLLENVPPARFDYESVKERLKKHGHIVAIRHSGGDVFHTLVVYGVGVAPDGTPNPGYFSVMNPNLYANHQAGYQNLAFAEQKVVSVGTKQSPTAKHEHAPTN